MVCPSLRNVFFYFVGLSGEKKKGTIHVILVEPTQILAAIYDSQL